MTSPSDTDTRSRDDVAGDRATLTASELEALRARVAEWDAQFDDDGLSRLHGGERPDDLQTDRSIATWVVQLVFPRLAVGEGWRLATQRRREGDRTRAWTFPVWPNGTVVDDGKDGDLRRTCDGPEGPFVPDRVIDPTLIDAMATVRGDGTLESYLEAAVLHRELTELGARGRTDPWRSHEIVDTNPFIAAGLVEARPDGPGPRSGLWTPEATREDDDAVTVRFWTASTAGPLRVLEHTLRFWSGSMRVDEARVELLPRHVDRVECWCEGF